MRERQRERENKSEREKEKIISGRSEGIIEQEREREK